MSIAANVTITGRLIGCIDSRDTTITSGIYMTLFPRVTCQVSRSVLYRPALLYCQYSDAISCRPASALCICMQRRVPGCQYARCSILSCCCFWSAQVGGKSLQDKMVKLISLKLTLKFLGSSNILQTRQEQIKHNSGASILAAELLWWWRGEVSRVTSGPCLHVSVSPLVLQKVPSEGS